MLPPTNLATRPLSSYCAHDSHNPEAEAGTNTFLEAGARLGEGAAWRSVPPRDWENWAEVPLQRERLLGLAQRTMNRGSSKVQTLHLVCRRSRSVDPDVVRLLVRKWPC